MAQKELIGARKAPKDEWYTQIKDIENELRHYKHFFKGKTVFCNCDDPYESNFFRYFAMNFNHLGLKKLITTCYVSSKVMYTQLSLFDDMEYSYPDPKTANKKPYKVEITDVSDENGDGAFDIEDIKLLLKNRKNVCTVLKGDGDFRSDECKALLKEADIVVTNPPFSLFRDYIDLLMEYDKKFILLGRQTSISLNDFFRYIMENRVWIGYGFNLSMIYKTPYENKEEANRKYVASKGFNPDEGYVKVPGICWYTNLDIDKRHEPLILYRKYNAAEYQKYDNYDAIHIGKIADIPCDYYDVMAVPITFLDKFNPEEFEILGITDRNNKYGLTTKIYTKADAKNYSDLNRRGAIKNPDGTYDAKFPTILIRRKEQPS